MVKVDAAAGLPGGRHRAHPRRHSGVRAVRAHAADRAEIRHPLQLAEFVERDGDRGSRREAGGGSQDAGGRGRGRARLHQFRAGRRRGGREGGEDPGDRRLRRRPLARRPRAARAHRDRLCSALDRLQVRHLFQRRQGDACRLHRADRRRARRPADQRVNSHADRDHRRNLDALRGDRLRPADPDVFAGRIRRHARQMAHARRLRQDQAARPPAEEIHLHHLRPARDRTVRRPRRARHLGGLRGAGRRPARSSQDRARAYHGRLHGLLPGRRRSAPCIRTGR